MNKIKNIIQSFFVFFLVFSQLGSAQAQAPLERSSSQSSLDQAESQDEAGVGIDRDLEENLSLNGLDFIPYARFVNYKYQGDGENFDAQDIIMEYPPDQNGIFQVSAYNSRGTVAYVYQIRSEGLYELAAFQNYNYVEDLRYSSEASSGQNALVLPSQLRIGSSFKAGYQGEKEMWVQALLESLTIGGAVYYHVVCICESQADGSRLNYYYAPSYGLIAIEKRANDNTNQTIMQLISVDGSLY